MHRRLWIVTSLALLTTVLALVALSRLYLTNPAQRLDRAKEYVNETLQRLATNTPPPDPAVQTQIGVYAGLTPALPTVEWAAPAYLRPPLAQALAESRTSHARAFIELDVDDAHVIAAAEPAQNGLYAWIAYPVRQTVSLTIWRWVIVALIAMTSLLCAAAIWAQLESGRTEETLIKELARREHLAALGRVVAGVAHEVRNPLAAIKLRLDLAMGASLPPDAERSIAIASSEIARLDRLVADLMSVAGRNVGPLRLTPLADLVRSRVEALGTWAEEQGVVVEVQGQADAEIDRDTLARAIDNVVRNAIEASNPNDTVRITISKDAKHAFVAVDDSGGGIPQERASEVFEPFFTTKPSGTGLGLAISRSIARAHGGDVLYVRDSAFTRFQFTLPIRA